MTSTVLPDIPAGDPASLTHYIEARFHSSHRSQFSELLGLAQKVERVHGNEPNVPAGLATLFEDMSRELEAHMRKEESVLFPAMRQGNMTGLQHPIAVMRADHASHDRDVSAIRELTNNLCPPQGACRSWTTLYEGLGQFISDLEQHMQLENEVLFPLFERPHQQDGCGCSCQGHD